MNRFQHSGKPRRSAITVGGLVLVASLSIVGQYAPFIQVTPFLNSSGPAPGQLNPQYVVIDLGTNLVNPVKITDSGYVLANYRVWHNGGTNLLQPLSTNTFSWNATDITEDGTVVGTEFVYSSALTNVYPDEGGEAFAGNLPNLAVWSAGGSSPGATLTPSLTPPPIINGCNADYLSGLGAEIAAQASVSDIGVLPAWGYSPYISPGHIWSQQVMGINGAGYPPILLDGFSATKSSPSTQTELGTMAYTSSATNLTGYAIYPLAANNADLCLMEKDSGYTNMPTGEYGISDWVQHMITYAVGPSATSGTTLPTGLIPLGGVGTLSNTNSLGSYYVLTSNAALQTLVIFGEADDNYYYATPTQYSCWDGVHTIVLPQFTTNLPPNIAPVGVNAMTTSLIVPGTGTNAPTMQVVPATQVIGNYSGYGYVWNMVPSTNTTPTFGAPQKLDWLVAGYGTTNAPWSGITAASINNGSAIVGAAKDTNSVSHGVLLLPCQITLLNGDTNTADRDGMFFDGTRPTTVSATSNYATAAIVTNFLYANGGTNVLGLVNALGQGRVDVPNGAYTFSLMIAAKVSPAAVTNITYGWNRVYQARNLAIMQVTTSTNTYWYVKSLNGATNFTTGCPTPNPDNPNPPGTDKTIVPSTNNNTVVFFDDPAMNMEFYTNFVGMHPDWLTNFTTATNFNTGDYIYQKRAFTYSLTNSIGTANAVSTVQVGTVTAAQKTGTNNVIATDWVGKTNIATTTFIPDCTNTTTSEIRALVGGTNPIVFDPAVTNNVPYTSN